MSTANIDNTVMNEIIYYSDGQAIDGLWHRLDIVTDFTERKNNFLWVLERLLKEGRIKLHKNGVFLESSIEDQIETFRHAFPESMKDADRVCTKPSYEVPYEDFGMNVWWFMDSCPAGIAWQVEDGSYEIAD
jgi:hypothetical protein